MRREEMADSPISFIQSPRFGKVICANLRRIQIIRSERLQHLGENVEFLISAMIFDNALQQGSGCGVTKFNQLAKWIDSFSPALLSYEILRLPVVGFGDIAH